MNKKQEIEQFIDGLRKVLFYVGHGKYNDHMTLEEITTLKSKLKIILEIEEEYEQDLSEDKIEEIYLKIKPYQNYSVKDFIDCDIKKI